jgi:hypothetical protein
MYEVIQNTDIATAGPWLVFVKKNGRLERAKHLGKRGSFQSREDAERAALNANKYGSQNV